MEHIENHISPHCIVDGMSVSEHVKTKRCLIEMLGGYSMAYAYCNSLSDGATACMRNNTIYSKESLELKLLEYRREHRIFEVGDKVVNDGLIAPHIYSFKKLMPEISMALVVRNGDEGACGLFKLRHATDEEIKAGHRL